MGLNFGLLTLHAFLFIKNSKSGLDCLLNLKNKILLTKLI